MPTTRDRAATHHPDLVKRAWNAPNKPDALWVADFTYVWTECGFVYVSFITDVDAGEVVPQGIEAVHEDVSGRSSPRTDDVDDV